MKIDCRGLVCPEPVINTKKSLEILPDDAILEVLVDSIASKENVIRFATNEGLSVSDEIAEDGATKITIVKGFACDITSADEEKVESSNEIESQNQEASSNQVEFSNKVLFLKDDRVGDNELGSTLIIGFLKSILELPKLPKTIICVNRAVFLTTADENSDVITILKALENKGVEIFSCGVCLNFYQVSDNLKVGMIGNAYGTIDSLLNSEGTITL